MKFNYKHLLSHLEKKPTIDELSNTLFQLGHENEFKNEIFDLELTPNRGDCLSLLGIARDLNYFYGHLNNMKIYDGELDNFNFDFKNHQPSACPQISFLYLEIESVCKNYCNYLQSYLDDLEINKVNFFTDISNYVSYELGQPSHCYDFLSLSGPIELNKLNGKKRFTTLLNEEIELNNNDLVFSIHDEIFNLAGIMGGAGTKCSNDTKKVLVEFAHFNPEDIIGRALKYNLKSDAAHKFERFVDPNIHDLALRRFIKIVQDHANLNEVKLYKYTDNKSNRKILELSPSKINGILGTSASDIEINKILSSLSFEIQENKVSIPSFRNDLTSANDISEEVARVIGYDNIASEKFDLPKQNKSLTKIDCLRKILNHNGFTEVINFQFSKEKKDQSISIDNPLDINKSYLRTTLKDSLTENLLFNERRQKDSIKIFEISDIYSINKQQNITVKKYLGLIASGRIANNYKEFSKKIDKNFIEEIFMHVDINLEKYISNIDRKSLDTKKKDDIFFIEVPLEEIETRSNAEKFDYHDNNILQQRYQEVSDFPSSNRDFSFLVNDIETINRISELISQFNSEILKDVFLFDFYEDPSNNLVKAAFRFIFQGAFHTLTDQEINKELEPLLSEILMLKNVSIPGYKHESS